MIVFIIVVSMVLEYTVLIPLFGSVVCLYILRPVFWAALSCYISKKPRVRFKGKLKLYRFIVLWSAVLAVVCVSVYFAGGFLDGIGASPYAKSPEGILANVICFGGVLVMAEWVRNYVVNRVKEKYLVLFAVIAAAVFSLYRLNLMLLASIDSWQQSVEIVSAYVLPEIMNNILLTYMVYIGGANPAIVYAAVTNLPVWLVPVLPNLEWITKAFTGIIIPAVSMVVLMQVYKKESREIKLREQKAEKPYAWVTVSVFSILIIWFAVGVFPVFPTVILTGSMEPAIRPGDVAILRKVDSSELRVGDVIQYWRGDLFTVHRIIHIEPTGEFQTKGDNNNAPDPGLVKPEQVRGKLVAVVPRVGFLSLRLKKLGRTPAGTAGF